METSTWHAGKQEMSTTLSHRTGRWWLGVCGLASRCVVKFTLMQPGVYGRSMHHQWASSTLVRTDNQQLLHPESAFLESNTLSKIPRLERLTRMLRCWPVRRFCGDHLNRHTSPQSAGSHLSWSTDIILPGRGASCLVRRCDSKLDTKEGMNR